MAAPVLISVDPPTGHVGTELNVTITGENFDTPTLESAYFGPGTITVIPPTINSDTEAIAIVTIKPDAVPGTRTVFVSNSDGDDHADIFEVVV